MEKREKKKEDIEEEGERRREVRWRKEKGRKRIYRKKGIEGGK